MADMAHLKASQFTKKAVAKVKGEDPAAPAPAKPNPFAKRKIPGKS